jgi:hypothetical protein
MTKGIVVDGADETVSNSDGATESRPATFDVQAALAQRDQSEYDELKQTLCDMEVDEDRSLPLYTIFQVGIVTSKSTGLVNCIVVADAFRDWVRENDITHVRCTDLSLSYVKAIRDVSEQLDVDVTVSSHRRTVDRLRASYWNYLTKFLYSMVLFVEQFLSMLRNAISRDASQSKILLVPYPGRFESIRPVISRFSDSTDASIVVTHLTILGFFKRNRGMRLPISLDPVRSFHDFASLRTVVHSLWSLFVTVPVALYLRRIEQNRLTDSIDREFDLYLPRSVAWAFVDNVMKGQEALFYYSLTKNVVRQSRCSCIVVGGDTPREKAITARANRLGVQTYYIPHSLTSRHEPVHEESTTVFASSEEEVSFLGRIGQNTTNMVPAGRPYLDELSAKTSVTADQSEGFTILVATQGLFPDTIRTELVGSVLDHTELMEAECTVTIKTHPSEDPEFYRALVEGPLAEYSDIVEITADGLEAELLAADLTVTITSNVGLESIALGTPTVVLDQWGGRSYSPRYPYQELAPIPILTTDDEVADFFDGLDQAAVEDLLTEQTAFFRDTYPDTDQASEYIVRYLKDTCTS